MSITITIIQAAPDSVSAFAAAIRAAFTAKPAADEPAPPTAQRTGFESGDGIVVDHGTGLVWAAATLPKRMSWDEAKEAVAKLNVGGFKDWRLPTVKELFNLIDHSRREPAIDVTAFPDTKSDWYWSSSSYAASSEGAWFVSFSSGVACCGRRDDAGLARAVRGASPRQ